MRTDVDTETKYDVLDHGYIRVDSVMGTDQDVARIARVSTGGGNKSEAADKAFLDYLWRKEHASPFEMPVVRLEIYAPIFVARQWVRHRTHSMNEYSGRYSEMPDDMYLPDAKRVRAQGTDNRQGSAEALEWEDAVVIQQRMMSDQSFVQSGYEYYLEQGVSKELARINLPLSQYTLFYWQQNLRNLLHFCRLRYDSHAQPEIYAYGHMIFEKVVKEYFPWTAETFQNWDIYSERFSGQMMSILRDLMMRPGNADLVRDLAKLHLRDSHAREFLEKLGLE